VFGLHFKILTLRNLVIGEVHFPCKSNVKFSGGQSRLLPLISWNTLLNYSWKCYYVHGTKPIFVWLTSPIPAWFTFVSKVKSKYVIEGSLRFRPKIPIVNMKGFMLIVVKDGSD